MVEAESYGDCMFNLVKNSQTVFHNSDPILPSHWQCVRAPPWARTWPSWFPGWWRFSKLFFLKGSHFTAFPQTFWSVSCLPRQIALVPVPESHISACKCFWNISPGCSFSLSWESCRFGKVKASSSLVLQGVTRQVKAQPHLWVFENLVLWEQGQLCCLHGLWFSRASQEAQVGYFYPGGKSRLEMPPRFPTKFCLVLPD